MIPCIQIEMVEPERKNSFWLPKNVKNWIEIVFDSKLYEQNNQIAEQFST